MVDFNVINDGNEVFPDDVSAAVESSPVLSPLSSLRSRREQIVNDLFTDIQVPRWDEPEIFVRFKPVSAMRLNSAIDRRRKAKGDDWSLLANADILVDACVGVYAVLDGDKENKLSLRPNDPNGTWTKFDPDLASALGIEATRAVDTCLALFLTEGDLLEVANKVVKWSGIANDEADETF